MKKLMLAIAVMLTAFSVEAQTLSGREIVKKMKDNPDGDTRYSMLDLVLEVYKKIIRFGGFDYANYRNL